MSEEANIPEEIGPFEKELTDLQGAHEAVTFDPEMPDTSDELMEAVQKRTEHLEDNLLEINSIVSSMEESGVNKQIAVDMENISPGVISSRVRVNSFTQERSKTNLAVAMEEANGLNRSLQMALLAALVFLGFKLYEWVRKTFTGSKEESQQRADEMEKALQRMRQIDGMVPQIAGALANTSSTSPVIVQSIASDIGFSESDFRHNPSLAIMSFLNKGFNEAVSKFYNHWVKTLLETPGKYDRFIHEVCHDIPKRIQAVSNAVDRLGNDIKNGKKLDEKEYHFDTSSIEAMLTVLGVKNHPSLNPHEKVGMVVEQVRILTGENQDKDAEVPLDRLERLNLHYAMLGSIDMAHLKTLEKLDTQLKHLEQVAKLSSADLKGLKIDAVGKAIRSNMLAIHGELRCVQMINLTNLGFTLGFSRAIEQRAKTMKKICMAAFDHPRVTPEQRIVFRGFADKLK